LPCSLAQNDSQFCLPFSRLICGPTNLLCLSPKQPNNEVRCGAGNAMSHSWNAPSEPYPSLGCPINPHYSEHHILALQIVSSPLFPFVLPLWELFGSRHSSGALYCNPAKKSTSYSIAPFWTAIKSYGPEQTKGKPSALFSAHLRPVGTEMIDFVCPCDVLRLGDMFTKSDIARTP
jgi:hypothetical protein